MWPFEPFSGAESKTEVAKTASVLFPLTPALSLRLIIAHIVFFVSGHDTVATLP